MGILAQAKRLMAWAEGWAYKLDKALDDEVIDTTTTVDLCGVRFEKGALCIPMNIGTELGTGVRNEIKIVLPSLEAPMSMPGLKITPIENGVQVLWTKKPPEEPEADARSPAADAV